jgi:hypothetical protein
VSAPRAPLLLLGALALAAGPALAPVLAAEPRSAIPWLSQSIEDTQPPPSRPPAGAPVLPGETITVRPLPALSRDGIGLLDPAETGFAPALWGPDDAAAAQALVLDHRDDGVPAARALFHRLLLADTQPPAGAGPSSALLVARVDRLLEAGDLAHADALIARAGPDTPDLFRRWFDIGLLLDRAGPACTALRQNPSLSPTLPARVFCLARTGDWNAAEITLTLGEQVGSIDADQQALLARFLDPVIFEGEPEPPAPEPLTPLDFLMREAVGLDRPPGQLPLAFLHADLDEHVPMRARVDAAERLTVSGALEPGVLFDAYRSGVPAASGGVWDRAAAVQALDAVLAGPPPAGGNGLADALAAADAALADRGLRVAFAEAYAPALAALDPAALPPEARARLSELLLLAGDVAGARHAAGAEPDARTAALLALAEGAGPAAEAAAAPDDPRLAAAIAGLAASEPADERERGLAADVASGRQGRAIVAALDLLVPGGAVDPPSLRAAILTLRLAGQDDAARTIAIETLLAGQPG